MAGPFTVESLSPHRVLAVDEDDELIDRAAEPRADYGPQQDFAAMILEQFATAGVQQAHKEDRIAFAAVTPWPGGYICAEGRYVEGDGDSGPEKRAGAFVGPEFGTVSRPDLVAAACEAGDAGFDVLIACAFNYEAQASEFKGLGRIPVLKARMNADLHMADELKNTGKGNLFVIFGEPDIDILPVGGDGAGGTRTQVKINGVDVFHPTTGEVRSDGADGIACWFIDTDYNEESFFVRQGGSGAGCTGCRAHRDRNRAPCAFLVTWNLRHIANAAARPRIEAVCRDAGIDLPLLCTPEQLVVAEDVGHEPDGP